MHEIPSAQPAPTEALRAKIKEAIKEANDVGRSRGSNNYAQNTRAVERLVDLEREIDVALSAAPAATQPTEECNVCGGVVLLTARAATQPTDAQILATLDGLMVTGENQNYGGVYRYRSLGTPCNVAGWTGNADADAALIMLDRLDVAGEDDARVDEIAAIVRRLAAQLGSPSGTGGSVVRVYEGVVEVCPECDISGCHHIRAARAAQAGGGNHEA